MCEFVTKDKSTFSWINSTLFDLVIVNGLFNDCAYAFAWRNKAPTILYASSGYFSWFTETYGYPDENYPDYKYHLPPNMTFLQEVSNALQPLIWKLYRSYYYLPKMDRIAREAIKDPSMPHVEDLEKQTSLILANTHFSEEFPKSIPPLIVQVGGMYLKEEIKPLSQDIKTFIEKWKDGFIYFSFGTYMKLPLLPQGHRDAIFTAIKKFPNIGFIVKWNGGEVPKNLPENVYTAEWMDQQAILNHPNARAFIAHGGLLGTQEAVFHGVPMIVFPIFAEQDYNAVRVHYSERGIMMEISELTADKLENAIREILTNEKYRKNMQRTSKIFRDRPQKPLDLAVYWVEYVLRHKDTQFLRPYGLNKSWFERRMLHVWGFLFAILIMTLIIAYKLTMFILWKIVFVGSQQKIKFN